MIFDRYANLKYKYGNRQFQCKGYYVDTVGRNKKAIQEYIKNQLQEDIASDQISLKEYLDPFTGEPVNKDKKKEKPLQGQPEKVKQLADHSERLEAQAK